MEIELQEIHDFLKAHVPFDVLPTSLLQMLLAGITIHYLRRGDAFPLSNINTPSYYLVRSGAIELRNQRGELVEKLGEGDSDGLNACGYVYCPGLAMATNEQWRQPLNTWIKYFSDWIERPEKKALKPAMRTMRSGNSSGRFRASRRRSASRQLT